MKKISVLLICTIIVLSGYIAGRIFIDNSNTASPASTRQLTIHELDLRIPTDETGVMTYHLLPDSPQPSVALSSNELTEQSHGMCAANKAAPPIGTLTKLGKPVDSLDASLVVDSKTVFMVADNYYLFTRPQAPCSTNSALTVLANHQRQAFIRALANATSTKDEAQNNSFEIAAALAIQYYKHNN